MQLICFINHNIFDCNAPFEIVMALHFGSCIIDVLCGIYSLVEGIDNEYLYKMIYYTCAPCTNYLKTEYNTRVAGEPDQSGSRQSV